MNQTTDKFKLIVTGIFAFFVLLGLVAFSTYKSTSTTTTTATINVWGTIDKIVFDNYINKYKQDKILDFKLAYTQKSLDTIDSELVEAIATGKAPDAILIPHTLIRRYLDKVYPITSIPTRTFLDTFVQESELYIQPDGSLFGLPFFIDPMVMYWNRDMYSSAGIANPPTKWTEFPLLAEKISKSDNNANITKSAVAFGKYNNINNAKALLSTLIMQAGCPIVYSENGRYVSRLDYQSSSDLMVPAESALQFYTDYSNPKKSVYSWNGSLPSSKQSFLSRDLATYFGFASEYTDIKEKNPNLNFDVAAIPQIVNAQKKTTFGELYGFAILKSSQNATQAYSLLLSLIGYDSVSTFLKFADVAPARRDLISNGSIDSAKSVFYNSALISSSWMDPDSNKTDEIFKNMIENVTSGKMNVKDSVSEAGLELGNLL